MSGPPRRIRRSARIVLLDPAGRTLLFRFTPPDREPFWTAPGGECDPGEDFPAAARRELFEETGIAADPAPLGQVLRYEFITLEGEPVEAEEHYFHLVTQRTVIDTSGHTELERATMLDHKWFAPEEIAGWDEAIYPLDLAGMMARITESAT